MCDGTISDVCSTPLDASGGVACAPPEVGADVCWLLLEACSFLPVFVCDASAFDTDPDGDSDGLKGICDVGSILLKTNCDMISRKLEFSCDVDGCDVDTISLEACSDVS